MRRHHLLDDDGHAQSAGAAAGLLQVVTDACGVGGCPDAPNRFPGCVRAAHVKLAGKLAGEGALGAVLQVGRRAYCVGGGGIQECGQLVVQRLRDRRSVLRVVCGGAGEADEGARHAEPSPRQCSEAKRLVAEEFGRIRRLAWQAADGQQQAVGADQGNDVANGHHPPSGRLISQDSSSRLLRRFTDHPDSLRTGRPRWPQGAHWREIDPEKGKSTAHGGYRDGRANSEQLAQGTTHQ